MKYICTVCGYVYDEEEEGMPLEKQDEQWFCPVCGVSKKDFEPVKDDNMK